MTRRRIWTNGRIVTGLDGTDPVSLDIAALDGRITDVGPDLPREGAEVIALDGRLVTAAFVDCHTHIVHGGDRARKFEMRLDGASYEEIARAAALSATIAELRLHVAELQDDRYMAPDLAAAAELVASGALADASGVDLPGVF